MEWVSKNSAYSSAYYHLKYANSNEPLRCLYKCNDCDHIFQDINITTNCQHCNTMNCMRLDAESDEYAKFKF